METELATGEPPPISADRMTTLTVQKKYTCLACGYTSKRRWRFILLGTRLVCRDITKCKGQK